MKLAMKLMAKKLADIKCSNIKKGKQKRGPKGIQLQFSQFTIRGLVESKGTSERTTPNEIIPFRNAWNQ